MNEADRQKQMDLVRDRFTRTATVFSDFVLHERVAEAERLADLLSLSGSERAIDVACGPGTLARVFARRVLWICGLDVTVAMLGRAQKEAADEQLGNFQPLCGNALAMPFREGIFDLAVTSYSIHHIPDATDAFREIGRVLRPGGKFGLIDMIVPENRDHSDACNHIERVRDPSHTRALPVSEFESLLSACGFRVFAHAREEHPRSYDHWMKVAGWKRGDAPYEEARKLLEASIPGNTAGFQPKFLREPSKGASDSRPDIELQHTAVFLVAQKQ
jgi:ubiquinone/menaquinone biosynthesis C-methylase UbiE